MGFVNDFLKGSKPSMPGAGYNEHTYHSFESFKVGLKKLSYEERDKVQAALEEERLWGRVLTGQRILDTVRGKCGYQLAKKLKEKVLSINPQVGLTQEQIQRNLNLARYYRVRDNEQGKDFLAAPRFAGNMYGVVKKVSANPNIPIEKDFKKEAAKGFMTKRPMI